MKKTREKHGYSLLSVSLRLFDGEGAGAATAAGGAGYGSGTAADSEHTPQGVRTGSGRAGRNTGGTPENGRASDAGRQDTPEGGGKSGREKQAAFRALIDGEYKEQYTQEIQKLIDRRFRESREREERTAPLLALLGRRYGLDPTDIPALTRAAAEERNAAPGEDPEAARERRIGSRLRQWTEEAEQLRETYPDFDLRGEVRNPGFLALLRAGVPLETAYRTLHYDSLVEDVRAEAAAEAERRVTENVRARGSRPREAGAGQPGAFTVRTDVSKLTREDMEEIKRRVLRGETVSF